MNISFFQNVQILLVMISGWTVRGNLYPELSRCNQTYPAELWTLEIVKLRPLWRAVRIRKFRTLLELIRLQDCWIPPAHELKKDKISFSRTRKIVLYKFSAKHVHAHIYHILESLRPTSRVPIKAQTTFYTNLETQKIGTKHEKFL